MRFDRIGVLILLSYLVSAIPMIAQSVVKASPVIQPSAEIKQKSPRKGPPTTGGIRRGTCQQKLAVISLIPNNEDLLTRNEFPTFWFYVGDLGTSPIPAELSLRDENLKSELVPIKLTGKAGILQVRSPIPLKPNQSYRWFFSVACDPQKPGANDPTVEGSVKRVAPTASVPSSSASGFWDDDLTLVVKNRDRDPQRWKSLLQKIDLNAGELEKIVSAPLLDWVAPTHNQLPTNKNGAQ